MIPSFWWRTQYGRLPEADLPGVPRELNPYERFIVRWLYAEWKVALLIPAGFLVGLLMVWATSGWRLP